MNFLDIEIDYIEGYSNPRVKKRDTFASVLRVIKGEANPQKREIESLRGYEKGSDTYNFYKSKLINFVPQASIIDSRSEANIEKLTGFVYFDIDDDKIGEFKLRSFDKSKVVLMNTSCGGKGISIWILTTGVTKDNFTAAKLFISKELGIEDLVDKRAYDISRSVCNSYDPNAFVNNEPFVFDCSSILPLTKKEVKKVSKPNQIEIEFNPLDFTRFGGSRLNSDRCLYVNENEPYRYYPEGVSIVERISRKLNSVKVGTRAVTLYTYLVNNIYLNRVKWDNNQAEFSLLVHAYRYNELFPTVSLKESEVQKIVKDLQDKVKNYESLKAIATKKKVIFNPNFRISKEEKQKITNSILHPKKNQLHKFLIENEGTCFTKQELCKELNIKQARLYQLINELPKELLPLILNNVSVRCDSKYDTILNCINNWDTNTNGKLGVTNIAKATGLNKKTVEKHYYKITK